MVSDMALFHMQYILQAVEACLVLVSVTASRHGKRSSDNQASTDLP